MMDQGVQLNPFLQLLFQRLDLTNQIRLGLTTLTSRAGFDPAHNPSRTVRNLSILSTVPTQIVGERSVIPGSSTSGCNWLTSPTNRSPIKTSSTSRIPLGRLITSGTTVCGNTTSDAKEEAAAGWGVRQRDLSNPSLGQRAAQLSPPP